jgi:hypothetical protein
MYILGINFTLEQICKVYIMLLALRFLQHNPSTQFLLGQIKSPVDRHEGTSVEMAANQLVGNLTLKATPVIAPATSLSKLNFRFDT